jgi:hypothetical protein
VNLPLDDFAKAHDGPPTDRKDILDRLQLRQSGSVKLRSQQSPDSDGLPGAPARAGQFTLLL